MWVGRSPAWAAGTTLLSAGMYAICVQAGPLWPRFTRGRPYRCLAVSCRPLPAQLLSNPPRSSPSQVLATGDMLDVCSSFMPRAAAGTGVQLLSPLWDIGRRLLLELVWAYGM